MNVATQYYERAIISVSGRADRPVDLSIVIVSYNTKDMLRDCLNRLSAAADGLVSETFVVDNASLDDSAGMVASEFPDVHLIANQDNAGFTRANNQALRLSIGRHVVILNPDTEAEPGSLAVLVHFLDDHPDVGAVGPKLLNSDGSLQPNGCRFPRPWREFLAVTGLRNLNRAAFERASWGREEFDQISEVDQVSGACLMVRGSVMQQVGMLDEDFYMFYEEVEWCWRIKQSGWKVFYVPQARVIHHWMGSVKQNSRAMTARLYQSSLVYYRKTGGIGSQLAIRAVMVMGHAKNSFIHSGVAVKRWVRGLRSGVHGKGATRS